MIYRIVLALIDWHARWFRHPRIVGEMVKGVPYTGGLYCADCREVRDAGKGRECFWHQPAYLGQCEVVVKDSEQVTRPWDVAS